MFNQIKSFVTGSSTSKENIKKDLEIFLKNYDKNIKFNKNDSDTLEINETLISMINTKTTEEKIAAYIYYFFYIIINYIVRPIKEADFLYTKIDVKILFNNYNKLEEWVNMININNIKDEYSNKILITSGKVPDLYVLFKTNIMIKTLTYIKFFLDNFHTKIDSKNKKELEGKYKEIDLKDTHEQMLLLNSTFSQVEDDFEQYVINVAVETVLNELNIE